MANTFKNVGDALTTAGADVYTCPASTQAVIHAIYISNIDGAVSADVTIKCTVDGGITYRHIAYTVPVPADSTLILDKPINMEAGDKLHMAASTDSDLELFMSILEIT
jgi:hypothetical protein